MLVLFNAFETRNITVYKIVQLNNKKIKYYSYTKKQRLIVCDLWLCQHL